MSKTKSIFVGIVLLLVVVSTALWGKIHIGSSYYYGILGVYARKCNYSLFGCFWHYERISSDIFNFKYIGSRSLAVDSKHVYCDGEILDADRNSVKVMDGDFANEDKIEIGGTIDVGIFKDSKQVYDRYCKPLTYIEWQDQQGHLNFDAPSFVVTPYVSSITYEGGVTKSSKIVQDKNGVYYFTPQFQRYVRFSTEPGPLTMRQLGQNSFELKGNIHTYRITKYPTALVFDTAF